MIDAARLLCRPEFAAQDLLNVERQLIYCIMSVQAIAIN